MTTFTEEYRNVVDHGPGPWADEPDKAVWVDEATDLDCMIVRGPHGGLCGYVGVPEGHPWYRVGFADCVAECGGEREWTFCDHTPESRVEVHGGLTFSALCSPSDEGPERGICHIGDGRPEVWWFGFDCAHAWDLTPRLGGYTDDLVYRDFAYVQGEIALLAAQLKAVKS